jgi:hypothetical protein
VHTVVSGSPHDPLDDLRPLEAPKWEQLGEFSDIRYEVAEGIAKLTICRPERRNAFRPQTLFELTDAFNLARDNPDVGVIILCGEGPDAFCSGGDQKIRGDDGYMGDDSVADRGIGRLNVLDLQILMRRIPKSAVSTGATVHRSWRAPSGSSGPRKSGSSAASTTRRRRSTGVSSTRWFRWTTSSARPWPGAGRS